MKNTDFSSSPIPALLPSNERENFRCLPFEGTFNFRDLGGYPAAKGKKTRWGLIYRSGGLKNLTQADLNYLAALGIKTVVDFRSEIEQSASPDPLPESINYRHMPIDAGGHELRDKLQQYIQGEIIFDLSKFMININKELVNKYLGVYRFWIHEFIDNNLVLPQVFHCTAGKDRTGFAAALLLNLLEVPIDLIFKDYMLTNTFNKEENEKVIANIQQANHHCAALGDVSPMLLAETQYLKTAFNEIERKWGNFMTFSRAEDGLALTIEEIDLLKKRFLE